MRTMSLSVACLLSVRWLLQALAIEPPEARVTKTGLEFVRVSADGRHFVLSGSRAEFRPWGFNYDHDAANRLLEDYWDREWNAVRGDFAEMKVLGANTVRIHLQVSRFMTSAQEPNRESLEQLARPLRLAEDVLCAASDAGFRGTEP